MLLNLKFAIIRDGRPQYKISQSLGWDPSKISKIIAEKYIPDSIEKEILAAELGTTVEALFNPDQKAAV